MRYLKQVLTASLLSLTLAACGQQTPTLDTSSKVGTQRVPDCEKLPSDPNDPPEFPCPVYPPPTPPNEDGVILSPGAVILDNSVIRYDDTSHILIVQANEITSAYQIGNTVVGGATPGAPAGVPPSKVLSIDRITPGEYALQLAYAPLTDIVTQGELNVTIPLTMADITSIESGDGPIRELGMPPLMQALSVECEVSGNTVANQTWQKNFDNFDFSGCVKVAVDTNFHIKISARAINNFEASATVNEQAKAQIKSTYRGNFSKSWTLGKVNFKTFTLNLGPVPILVSPSIKFIVGADGSINNDIQYEFSQKASYKAGIQIKNNDLSLISDKSFDVDFPNPINQFTEDAWSKVYVEVRPIISFWTTGIVAHADGDLYGSIRGYGKLNITPSNAPKWLFTTGPQFCYGFNVKLEVLFGLFDKSWNGDKCGDEIVLKAIPDPSTVNTGSQWNNVTLNFGLTDGSIELYKVDPLDNVTKVASFDNSTAFDLTPFIDPLGSKFFVVGVSKRSSGIFGNYRHHLSLSVSADNNVVWNPGERGCSGCHSATEYSFLVNKVTGTISPW